MNRPTLLNEREISDKLAEHPFWNKENDTIVREVVCANFPSVIGFLNAIAFIAEKLDHHPDLLIYGWNKLRITISTHDKGGLTELDFLLAKQIDDIKF
ncbi:MAG TPA: 4a-hydroxytetrahydrobiopterin dehydratase [Candidatus Kapabacteria bacterium]|nr:4a-hydroxytetrahydrobiopterin dehydratase [Candidatus Kapabacteria bacterium]